MTFEPYFSITPIIQFHIACALLALLIGPIAFYQKKRSRRHKMVGYTWVTLIGSVALSSFAITSFGVVGPFSPIHLLVIWTLWSLYIAIRHAAAGRIHLHRVVMRNLYWYGLIIAGLFNFLPGRATNALFFQGQEHLGYYVLGGGIAVLVVNSWRQSRKVASNGIFPLEKPAAMG